MNRHVLARFLRFAVISCVLLSCLIALQTPVLAVAIYDAFAQVSVSAPGSGITLSSSVFSSTSEFELGNAAASASTSASPRGTVSAFVTGVASKGGPDNSIARSFASGFGFVNLFNQNTTTVLFPLTISHRLSTFTGVIPSNETGGATARAGFRVGLGAVQQLSSGSLSLCGPNDLEPPPRPECRVEDFGVTTFMLGLSPGGGRSLNIEVFVDGEAGSPTAVPEPATLLLFGTTMAGIGLARWRRRKLKQESGSH